MNICSTLSKDLNLSISAVENVIQLLDSGCTIPFIARYRKEKTGSMDDQVLRTLAEKLERLRSFEKRRNEILHILEEQALLSPELAQKINSANTLTALEDLYRPYKQKRKTRATIAAERGLSPPYLPHHATAFLHRNLTPACVSVCLGRFRC